MTLLSDLSDFAKALIQFVVGSLIMALGVVGLWWEKTHAPTHDSHLLACLVVALVGASIIPSIGPVLVGSLKSIVGVLISVLPSRPQQPPTP